MKKLLLSLGTVAAIAAPITAVVACGDSPEEVKTYGISVKKATATDVKITLAGTKTGSSGSEQTYVDHKYFVPAGSTEVKILKTEATGSAAATYATLKAADGSAITATTSSFKIDDEVTTGTAPDAAAANAADYGVMALEVNSYVAAGDFDPTLKALFNKEGEVKSDATTATKASQETIDSLNAILNPVDKAVNTITVTPGSGTGASATPAQLNAFTTAAKADVEAVESLNEKMGKITYSGISSSMSVTAKAQATTADKGAFETALKTLGGGSAISAVSVANVPEFVQGIVVKVQFFAKAGSGSTETPGKVVIEVSKGGVIRTTSIDIEIPAAAA